MSVLPTEVARFGVRTTVAAMFLGTVLAQPPAKVPTEVALYAGVGEALIMFGVDVERATLARQSSLTLPGFVQEAWASPSTRLLYVAWSNGGASYAGSALSRWETGTASRSSASAPTAPCASTVRPRGCAHAPSTSPAMDPAGTCSWRTDDPSGVSVHAINPDGSVGGEVPQRASIDAGVYAHQVRVLPSNRAVVVVTRGNDPTASSREDPGALKVFRYDAGALSNEISIAPQNGVGFRARHLDFHRRAHGCS